MTLLTIRWLRTSLKQIYSYSLSWQPSKLSEPRDERKHNFPEPKTQDLVTASTKAYNFLGSLIAAALYYYLTLYWSDYLYTFDTILTVYLAEYCGWANEKVRHNIENHEASKTQAYPDLSVTEKGEYRGHLKHSSKPQLGCIAAIVGYREDPVIFTKALESYLDAEGCDFVLTCIDGNEAEDQVMVDVFQKVWYSILVLRNLSSCASVDNLGMIRSTPLALLFSISPLPSWTLHSKWISMLIPGDKMRFSSRNA
jgi:hyaluronan synthase